MRTRLFGSRRGVEIFVLMVVGLALASYYFFNNWLLDERGVTVATPSPPPFKVDEPLRLSGGQRACMDRVAFTPRTQVASFAIASRSKRQVPVAFEASGPGYSARGVARSYPEGKPVPVPFEAPDRELLGRACFHNLGSRPVWLSATREGRVASSLQTEIDGVVQEVDIGLVFFTSRERDVLSQLPAVFERIANWQPLGRPILWAIFVLLIAVVPLGTAWAFASSVGRSDDDAADAVSPPAR
jgi:hypothetical protein